MLQDAASSGSSEDTDLQQENQRLKAQIQALTARLAQHAQHAQQLLAGTEPFFEAQAGSLIGQPIEAEEEGSHADSDSDSDASFASARERALSRPLSASSSFRSADSSAFSSAQSRNLSVSPEKGSRGVSMGLQGGLPGVAAASFETAVEEVLSSSAGQAVQASSEGTYQQHMSLATMSRIVGMHIGSLTVSKALEVICLICLMLCWLTSDAQSPRSSAIEPALLNVLTSVST